MDKWRTLTGFKDGLSQNQCYFQHGVGQNDNKPRAAVSESKICTGNHLDQSVGKFFKHCIPKRKAMNIIEFLKIIQLDDDA